MAKREFLNKTSSIISEQITRLRLGFTNYSIKLYERKLPNAFLYVFSAPSSAAETAPSVRSQNANVCSHTIDTPSANVAAHCQRVRRIHWRLGNLRNNISINWRKPFNAVPMFGSYSLPFDCRMSESAEPFSMWPVATE